MRCSRTEAPSLHRRYPASSVVRASPPPCSARPDPRGLSVGACHATGRASRVASIPLVHTCRRHYPGGTGRCSRRSLPDRWQPSPCSGRVGFRITRFEACAAFYVLLPVMRCRHPCPLRNLDWVVVLQRITSCLYSDRRYAMSPLSSRYDLPSAGSAGSKNAIAFAFLSISISA